MEKVMENTTGGQQPSGMRRRDLLSMIGAVAGSAAMYQAMTTLGFAEESGYKGPIKLDGDPKGASILILGAGLAGMTAALELRKAGYKVQILEFNTRPGGRNWTLRGGDRYTELGGTEQACEFAEGLISIPAHGGSLITIMAFSITANGSAWRSNRSSSSITMPCCIRLARLAANRSGFCEIKTDFQGHTSELLAKVTQQGKLDDAVSKDDKEILLQALKSWGALDSNYTYKASEISAELRGYAKEPGGGLNAAPVPGDPIGLSDDLEIPAVALPAGFHISRIPDHHVSAGRWHGYDRQSLCQAGRRRHPLRRQGDPDSAGRRRRDRNLYRRQKPGHAAAG